MEYLYVATEGLGAVLYLRSRTCDKTIGRRVDSIAGCMEKVSTT